MEQNGGNGDKQGQICGQGAAKEPEMELSAITTTECNALTEEQSMKVTWDLFCLIFGDMIDSCPSSDDTSRNRWIFEIIWQELNVKMDGKDGPEGCEDPQDRSNICHRPLQQKSGKASSTVNDPGLNVGPREPLGRISGSATGGGGPIQRTIQEMLPVGKGRGGDSTGSHSLRDLILGRLCSVDSDRYHVGATAFLATLMVIMAGLVALLMGQMSNDLLG